jgi:hypothetical protein
MARFATSALHTARIHIAENAARPVAFAADELAAYLRVMTGADVPIVTSAALLGRDALVLGSTPGTLPGLAATAGFSLAPEALRITAEGGSPGALLAGVYALLEQCGCRWSLHGRQEETVPRVTAASIDLAPTRHTPRFAARGYCSDIMTWHYTQPEHLHDRLGDDRAFIDWMGKSGANTFFFIRHPFDTQLTIPELVPEFEQRGIDLEYGGHVIPLLLPRELYRDHPEYFPQSPEGQRTDFGNLCTHSRAALATASANAVQYVRDYPEMKVVHIWGADLWRGGWCHCADCRAVSVQDQSLRICNAVARGLGEAALSRPVCYLAYHDTVEADLTLRPEANVFAEFAPRERCYGHALNDSECATNRRYAAALERYVDLFDGRIRVFEYYGDAILFCGCAVPLAQVIGADLEYFRRLGIPGITMLQFGTYSLWAYPANFLAFADGTAGGRRQGTPAAAGAIDAYCARFGAHAGAAREALAGLESIMQGVATYGDIRRPPRGTDAAAVLASIAAAAPRIEALAARLEGLPDDALAAQAALLRYTRLILNGVRHEMREREVGPAGPIYEEALQIVDAVDRRFKGLWGAIDLRVIHAFYDAAAASA